MDPGTFPAGGPSGRFREPSLHWPVNQYRVRGLEVDPVLGREVVEGEEHVEIVDDLGDRLGPFATELVRERVCCPSGVITVFGVADLGQHPSGRGVCGLRQGGEHVGD